MGGRGGSSGISAKGNGVPKMPQLQGTEKQVKWAEDIRKRGIEGLAYLNSDSKDYSQFAATSSRNRLRDRGYGEYMPDMQKRDKAEALSKLKKIHDDALRKIADITDAEWFIKRRSIDIFDLFPDKKRK